ncbi:MAG TPA: M3 family oligoendopeptidase [Candidatus Nanoarchaeia archaeon]|nr:M3 family oligoendopeptidase [Candidatus Nanoarchaeia archaeon]
MASKTWDKKDLLPQIDSKGYNSLLNDLENHVKHIEAYKTRLKPNFPPQEFMNVLKTKEKISLICNKLHSYAYLWFSEDTSNSAAKNFMSKIDEIVVDVDNRIMFFSLWFKSLDEENASNIINGVDREYKYYLQYARLLKKYILSEPEEKILNIKGITSSAALIKIYDIITSAFTFTLKIGGKTQILSREQLADYVKHPKANVRKAAYQALYDVYSKNQDVLNEVYRNIILDWKNEGINLRKFESPMTIRNKSNDISDKSIEVLIKVCKKNKNLFQEYFKLKTKLCKLKVMNRYDVYVPYGNYDKKYSYEDAQKLVFDSYYDYSPEMYKLAKKIVDEKHIDYLLRKNKMGGAYCMDVGPGITPYVLLNFNSKLRDVFTMAHELGHGVHDLLTSKHSNLTAHPPLTLAETASTFGEMLLFDKLMKESKDKNFKKYLLAHNLDDLYATTLRQIYFVDFEIKAHELIAKGAGLEELKKAYLEVLKEQFGNSVKINEEFQYEWLSIPHIFHTPFYCYSYSFGNLLVLSLYEKYREEGKSFVPKYLKILSYGGSENSAKILKEINIDIEDEKFWQKGFDLIKEMIDELKKLV